MRYLSSLDYTIIAAYVGCLVGIGLYLRKKASGSLEDYFLGGRKLPGWALGLAGAASFIDVSGPMLIVAFLYMIGPRGFFIEFRGGAALLLTFYMLWVGKWHRRSQCITGAEWMVFRFGEGLWGQVSRVVSVLARVVLHVALLALLVKGIGLFLSLFIPLPPFQCALLAVSIATLYTLVSGFYGVVVTDIFQTVLVLVAIAFITIKAFTCFSDGSQLANLAQQVTKSTEWMTCYPQWKTSMPIGGEYKQFEFLVLFAFFYLIRNVLAGMGMGDDPKYFGARSDRECGTLTAIWIIVYGFLWLMMMGYAVIGLFLIKDLFPDPAALTDAAALIKQHFPDITKAQWADTVGALRLNPANYSQELTSGLRAILGSDWVAKLNLLGFEGSIDPERLLPAVILFRIPMGIRGLIIVAALSASMSTFDAYVNSTVGFFTRDVYQRYLHPKASNRELIYASWAFGIAMVAVAFPLGYFTKSINEIWGWAWVCLGGGLMVPLVLRFYWWRFNGGGFAIGTVVGMAAAVLQKILWMVGEQKWGWQPLSDLEMFILSASIGFTFSMIGTYITKPTDRLVLENFYRITRPFGIWGSLKKILPDDVRGAMEQEHRYDLIAVPFALAWQITFYLMPMELLIRNYKAFWITLPFFIISTLGMYFFWYKKLPPAHNQNEITVSKQSYGCSDK